VLWYIVINFGKIGYCSSSSVSWMARNCSRASSRFSMISAASISGGGRFSSYVIGSSLIRVMFGLVLFALGDMCGMFGARV